MNPTPLSVHPKTHTPITTIIIHLNHKYVNPLNKFSYNINSALQIWMYNFF